MARVSRAGPGEGVDNADEVIIENHDEFGEERLFIAWRGNGYTEDTCWILSDLDMVCKLSSWE